jgi:hypothetical protein
MTPLGKLQENESISNLWDQERAFMSDASSEAIPPIFQEKVVPSCPKLRMWSISEELIEDPITTIITTKYPLVPALARQQIAKMVAIITIFHPMPALARFQMAKDPVIITSAIIMTTHSMSALVHQIAKGLAIIFAVQFHI